MTERPGAGATSARTLRVAAVAARAVSDRLVPLRQELSGRGDARLELVEEPGEVHVRITSAAGGSRDPRPLVAAEQRARELLGDLVYGAGDDTLGHVLHRMLVERRATVAVAESLTGGLVGAALTAAPGSSASFRGGVTAYATDLKATVLGVPQELLARVGAVHPDVAVAMAAGVRDRLGATYGLALTGVAGPDPQDAKPPGTLHIGLATEGGSPAVVSPRLRGDRREIRRAAVAYALGQLRHHLLRGGVPGEAAR